MKRIFIAAALVLAVQVAGAQTKSPAAAQKAITSAEAAASNAKKATKVATWLNLAKAYMDAYNAPVGNVWMGMGQQEFQIGRAHV